MRLANEFGKDAGAMAEFFRWHPGLLHEGEPVVGKGGVFLGEGEVATERDVFGSAPREDGGNVLELMAAAQVGAVADNAVVEEAGAVAVFGFLETVEEVG